MVEIGVDTIAIPPGETSKEMLEEQGMTQKEFADRMNCTEKHICKLINGEVALTPKTASRLEIVLGTPASFWNGLEAGYREDLQRVRKAAKYPMTFDEDCLELTDQELREFRPVNPALHANLVARI